MRPKLLSQPESEADTLCRGKVSCHVREGEEHPLFQGRSQKPEDHPHPGLLDQEQVTESFGSIISDLVECVVDVATYPALVLASSRLDSKFSVSDTLDVTVPLYDSDDGSLTQEHIHERISTDVERIELIQSKNPTLKNAVQLLKSYRDHGDTLRDNPILPAVFVTAIEKDPKFGKNGPAHKQPYLDRILLSIGNAKFLSLFKALMRQ